MRKEQVVPALGHDPGPLGHWPRSVRIFVYDVRRKITHPVSQECRRRAMILPGLLLSASVAAAFQAGAAPQSSTDCSTALSRGNSAAALTAAVQMCLGEEQLKLADAAPRDDTDRTRFLLMAVDHYRRAEGLAPD